MSEEEWEKMKEKIRYCVDQKWPLTNCLYYLISMPTLDDLKGVRGKGEVVGQRLAECGSNGWSVNGGLVAIIKGASEEDWEKMNENISYCAKQK